MRPKDDWTAQGRLFERELETLIVKSHPLVKLSEQIDWKRFEDKFGAIYSAEAGRRATATRLMVGLTYLKFLYNASDEALMHTWVENPYWQYFCGERYFQHEPPCDRSLMSRWRKRIGKSGAQEMFDETLAVANVLGLLKFRSLNELYADTTVQEKNISYPSEANLLNRLRKRLVCLAQKEGISLRQSYVRVGKLHQIKAHRYAAAQQWNRARREIKRLRTIVGRLVRDITRKVSSEKKAVFAELFGLYRRLIDRSKGAEKLYSIHEPHVEGIAKGKMHKRFEFGVKVSVVTTRRGGFVLGCKAIHGNPYDGHTLKEALKDVEVRLGKPLDSKVGVDLGYRGHGVTERFRVFHPRLKKLSKYNRLFIRARSKVEATISLMKRCFRLGTNYLKGMVGDAMNAIFAGAACNLSNIIRAQT